jgi:antirestriction protein ArdC
MPARQSPAAAYARKDMYQIITDQIVGLLEQGVRPWTRSWGGNDAFSRPLRHNGQPYSGVNVLTLWATAQLKGYTSATWMTFNQAKQLGGFVRAGEKGALVVYFEPKVANAGTADEQRYAILKSYTVFNTEQIDNLPEKFQPKAPVEMVVSHERIEHADAFFDALGMKVSHGGTKAYYMPSQHRVQMPEFESFFTAEAYYATKMHEAVHWTKHETILDRKFESDRWGDEGYAIEELVAELGAAFGMADLNLVNHPREDHASYIAHWLKVLKNDKKAIFTAARHAEAAIKKLHEIAGQKMDAVVQDEDAESAEVLEMVA